MNATQHLQAAIACLAERGKQYDNPEGERSMEATVDAFEAVTGHSLTVTQGWLFMALLKAVRTQQGEYKADSFIDGAAYFALAGESAAQVALSVASHDDWEAGEARMDAIGMNGNDGAHYPAEQRPSAHWSHDNPGLADQYRAEALAARRSLGFAQDACDVAPADITAAIELLARPAPPHSR